MDGSVRFVLSVSIFTPNVVFEDFCAYFGPFSFAFFVLAVLVFFPSLFVWQKSKVDDVVQAKKDMNTPVCVYSTCVCVSVCVRDEESCVCLGTQLMIK